MTGFPPKITHRSLAGTIAGVLSQYFSWAFPRNQGSMHLFKAWPPKLEEHLYCKPPSLRQLVTAVCHLWWQRAEVNSASESLESPVSPDPSHCKGWASLGQSPVLCPVSRAPWRLCSLRCADSSQLERLPLMKSQTKHAPLLGLKSPATWQ